MKRILLLFLFISFVNLTSAQYDANFIKYWQYRYRLLGDDNNRAANPGFVKVGAESGMSIPMSNQDKYKNNCFYTINPEKKKIGDEFYWKNNFYPGISCRTYIPSGDSTINSLPSKYGILSWGDATITLGNYIAVLATEWKLLHINGEDTYETTRELYYALNALYRVDAAGEFFYDKDPSLNGFFIRDDVPFELQAYFGDSDPAKDEYQMVTSAYNGRLAYKNWMGFQYECDIPMDNDKKKLCEESKNNFPKICNMSMASQDQVIGILFGLTFVIKMLDGAVFYENNNLKAMAQNISNRLLENYTWLWVVNDPENNAVCNGPYSIFFSWPLLKTFEKIDPSIKFDAGIVKFKPLIATSVGLLSWQTITSQMTANPGHSFDLGLIHGTLKTICDVLYPLVKAKYPEQAKMINDIPYLLHKIWELENWSYNLNMIMKLAVMSNSFPRQTIVANSYPIVPYLLADNRKEIYDLADIVLNNRQPLPPFNASYWENNILNSAPCVGPCYDTKKFSEWYDSKREPVEGWWNDNRFANYNHPDDSDVVFYGDYNGLDYMLAYNLYRLAFDQTGYKRMAVFSREFSLGNWIATGSYKAPDAIRTKCSVGGNVNLELRAGNIIEFLPGFAMYEGSTLDAEIDPSLQCSNGTYNDMDLYSEYYNEAILKLKNELDSLKSIKIPPDNEFQYNLHNKNMNFAITPNPSNGIVKLFIVNSFTDTYRIEIANMNGKNVFTKDNIETDEVELNLSALSNGMYIVKLICIENQDYELQKIIIQK